ncbi:hypothetical protein [Mesorhizobium onobrychidis]|uniref:Uncharacterized protein n=1 Tax=Mesorhizobium onobrychidis TaxID=2775404 RepID=A0ABY5R111_9HYPH|nr:hypothetical protein [Mesorhizobium onobrychidis]UVC17170.1 hypothetical protein IHQ72_08655 [Mesorhizobium onobrychidis]
MDITSQGVVIAGRWQRQRARYWAELGQHQMSKNEPTELSLQKRIELQFKEDFRVDPLHPVESSERLRRAYARYGLTASLKRAVAVGFVLWFGVLIWLALHH